MKHKNEFDIAVWANAGNKESRIFIPGVTRQSPGQSRQTSGQSRQTSGQSRRASNICPGAGPFDVILVTAEAFIDHPSFGTAVIARVLRSLGLTVAVIAQPEPSRPEDFGVFGRPNLFFGVTAGNLDSLVRNYTPALKDREADAYSENGVFKGVCYLPTVVYSNLLRRVHGRVPIVVGGVEASMRKAAHFDYRKNSLAESILAASGADLLVYGNGETQVAAIAKALTTARAMADLKTKDVSGQSVSVPLDIPGTAWLVRESTRSLVPLDGVVRIPGYTDISDNPKLLGEATITLERALSDPGCRGVVQGQIKNDIFINKPPPPPSSGDLDAVFTLPFTRRPAPVYSGEIKAFEMIRFSITTHRGCYGSCTFCCLAAHQGRTVVSRSRESILSEVVLLTGEPGFKGYITDMGGPSANMYASGCPRLNAGTPCHDRRCVGHGGVCPTLRSGLGEYASLLAEAAAIPGVKKVFVASGIRFDLLNRFDPDGKFLSALVLNHTSGHFKIAPEHTANRVLSLMNKPPLKALEEFLQRFDKVKSRAKAKVFVLPYFISSFPGCSASDMAQTSGYARRRFGRIEQVQDFVPTPGTIAAAIYFSGWDPVSGMKVEVERTRKGRQAQRNMLNFGKPDTSKDRSSARPGRTTKGA